MRTIGFLVFLILASQIEAYGAEDLPQSLTLDGRLYANTSPKTPLLDTGTFKIQILDYAGTCVLYEERQSFDTRGSSGYFNINIGEKSSGTTKRTTGDSGHTLAQIFTNDGGTISGKTLSNGSACSGAGSSGNGRSVLITVTTSSDPTPRVMSSFLLNSVPSAFVSERAESLEGIKASGFLQVNNIAPASLSQSNLENIFSTANYAKLTDLLSGNSNFYVAAGANGTIQAPAISGTPSSPAAGQIWYDAGVMKYWDGSSAQALSAGSGITSLTIGAGLTPTGTITTGGSTIAVDTGITAGKIVQVQTGGKLPALDGSDLTGVVAAITNAASLANGKTWIGDAGGKAQEAFISVTDIRSTQAGNAQFFPTTCTAGQTLTWQSGTDTMVCTNISLPASQITGTTAAFVLNGGQTGAVTAGTNDATALTLETSNFPRVTIDSAGKVGIDTASPSATLHVRQISDTYNNGLMLQRATGNDNAYQFAINSSNTLYLGYAADGLAATFNSNTRMALDSSGRVGIGTTLPVGKLTVSEAQSTDLTDVTDQLTKSGINIVSTYGTGGVYQPGVFWSTSDNNPTKPKAGIWSSVTNDGSFLFLGTSSNYSSGVTHLPMAIDPLGRVSINYGPDPRFSLVVNGWETSTRLIQKNAANNAIVPTLQVHADANVPAVGLGPAIVLGAPLETDGQHEMARVGSVWTEATVADHSADLFFSTVSNANGAIEATEKMRLSAAGNLGIGTDAPTSLLHTNDSAAKTASFVSVDHSVTNTSSTASVTKVGMRISSTGTWDGANAINTGLYVNVGGATYYNNAAVFDGGPVVIGANSGAGIQVANANLIVGRNMVSSYTSSSNVYNTPSFTSYLGNSWSSDTNTALLGFHTRNSGNGNQYSYIGALGGTTNYAPTIVFGHSTGNSSYSEMMRIDPTGNVGIGTTDPTTKLHVLGNLRVQGSTDCTLGNGSGGTNCTSDIRLKTNIQEIQNPLGKILSLRGVEFDWNEKSQSPGAHAIGVIAQDVEKQFPTAVIQDSSTGYKKVDYAVLIAPVIQAFKELNKRVTELLGMSEDQSRRLASVEEENAQLKMKMKALEEKLENLEKKLESK